LFFSRIVSRGYGAASSRVGAGCDCHITSTRTRHMGKESHELV
jgi:hypothetical protein